MHSIFGVLPLNYQRLTGIVLTKRWKEKGRIRDIGKYESLERAVFPRSYALLTASL